MQEIQFSSVNCLSSLPNILNYQCFDFLQIIEMKPMSNNKRQKKSMEELKSNGNMKITRKKELNKEDFQEKS